MKTTMKLLMVSVFALMIAAPAALAQTPEVSTLQVDEPLDVGGTILQPGVYTIRVVPALGNRNRVQVTSTDLKTVYATVLTVPHDLEPTEEVPNTTFVYFPAGEGQPKALRTWFAPNSAMQAGHDIVYEESRAKQLARLARQNVVYYPEDVEIAETTELAVVTPEATIETYTWTAPTTTTTTTTTKVVTPAPMTSSVQVAETTPVEMPRTAGNLPLLALLGFVAVGGAVAIRAARS
jgi:hypothetical protein